MIAILAGTGDLPGLLAQRLYHRGTEAVFCQLQGFAVTGIRRHAIIDYRIEEFGTLLADLRARGVTQVCLAGAVRRPPIEAARIDAATQPLINRLAGAMLRGDDGTLRAVLEILEEAGFAILSAAAIAPDLLPAAQIPTRAVPTPAQQIDTLRAAAIHQAMALADVGQACVVRGGQAMAIEAAPGTDWMLQSLGPRGDADLPARGGVLFKAPKPGQDRRVDLPVIGPRTVDLARQAGLSAIVIEAGGVMVLDLAAVTAACDAAGVALWIRPPA